MSDVNPVQIFSVREWDDGRVLTFEVQTQPVEPGRVVAIKAYRTLVIGHHHINVAVIVEVGKRRTAADIRQRESRPAVDAQINAVAVVQQQLIRLLQRWLDLSESLLVQCFESDISP